MVRPVCTASCRSENATHPQAQEAPQSRRSHAHRRPLGSRLKYRSSSGDDRAVAAKAMSKRKQGESWNTDTSSACLTEADDFVVCGR